MFERFTDGARQVVVFAQEEARRLNHDHIGTEHLLLATLRVRDGIAARALRSLGVTPEDVRRQVDVLAEKGGRPPETHIPFTVRGKKALELALREALELQHDYIGPEHLLLGILRGGDGAAVRVLVSLGVEITEARDRVKELVTGPQEEVEVEVDQQANAEGIFAVQGWAMEMQPQSGEEPRCARCNTEMMGNLRARTVQAASHATGTAPPQVTLVWCGSCGVVVGALPAPPG